MFETELSQYNKNNHPMYLRLNKKTGNKQNLKKKYNKIN